MDWCFLTQYANDYFYQKENGETNVQDVENALMLRVKCFDAKHNRTKNDNNTDNGLEGFAIGSLTDKKVHGRIGVFDQQFMGCKFYLKMYLMRLDGRFFRSGQLSNFSFF